MRDSAFISEQVRAYRSLPPSSDTAGDSIENDRKVNIVASLDENANEPVVAQLLHDVLCDKSEYDLARIEAAKIVGIYVTAECSLERELKRHVWEIFVDKAEDCLVRQHASQQIEVGFGGPDEQQQIAEILFDATDDEDVRHGAFAYLKQIKSTQFARELIERLLIDPYWRQYSSSIEKLRS
jgi:hypothetical protein